MIKSSDNLKECALTSKAIREGFDLPLIVDDQGEFKALGEALLIIVNKDD